MQTAPTSIPSSRLREPKGYVHKSVKADSDFIKSFLVHIEKDPVGNLRYFARRNCSSRGLALAPLSIDTVVKGKGSVEVVRCTHVDLTRYRADDIRLLERRRGCGKPRRNSPAWFAQLARCAKQKARGLDKRHNKPLSVVAAVVAFSHAGV